MTEAKEPKEEPNKQRDLQDESAAKSRKPSPAWRSHTVEGDPKLIHAQYKKGDKVEVKQGRSTLHPNGPWTIQKVYFIDQAARYDVKNTKGETKNGLEEDKFK